MPTAVTSGTASVRCIQKTQLILFILRAVLLAGRMAWRYHASIRYQHQAASLREPWLKNKKGATPWAFYCPCRSRRAAKETRRQSQNVSIHPIPACMHNHDVKRARTHEIAVSKLRGWKRRVRTHPQPERAVHLRWMMVAKNNLIDSTPSPRHLGQAVTSTRTTRTDSGRLARISCHS